MMTNDDLERVRGWFTGRLPEEWKVAAPEVSVDREEITVILTIADVEAADDASDAERDEARVGRASAFREDTRHQRMSIADEAQHRFERKVSWGVRLDGIPDQTALFTHVAAPVMTRLRQPQRQVLGWRSSAPRWSRSPTCGRRARRPEPPAIRTAQYVVMRSARIRAYRVVRESPSSRAAFTLLPSHRRRVATMTSRWTASSGAVGRAGTSER